MPEHFLDSIWSFEVAGGHNAFSIFASSGEEDLLSGVKGHIHEFSHAVLGERIVESCSLTARPLPHSFFVGVFRTPSSAVFVPSSSSLDISLSRKKFLEWLLTLAFVLLLPMGDFDPWSPTCGSGGEIGDAVTSEILLMDALRPSCSSLWSRVNPATQEHRGQKQSLLENSQVFSVGYRRIQIVYEKRKNVTKFFVNWIYC